MPRDIFYRPAHIKRLLGGMSFAPFYSRSDIRVCEPAYKLMNAGKHSELTMFLETFSAANKNRYSAKASTRLINFLYSAPNATQVSVIGDFNNWDSEAHPMVRQPDGGWLARIPLHHGHHRYQFLVDGSPVLDPRAQGVSRNERNERVSLLAVS